MPSRFSFSQLSLTKQILLPFFLLLLLLAGATSIGSSLLLRNAIGTAIDERLGSIQQLVYQDLKQQEQQLAHLATRLAQLVPTHSRLQLAEEVRRQRQNLKFYLATPEDASPEELQGLLVSVQKRRGQIQMVTFDDNLKQYNLSLGLPLSGPQAGSILCLQLPLGSLLLEHLAEHFQADFHLLSEQGELVASNPGASSKLPQLDKAELAELATGGSLLLSQNDERPRRLSYAPLPLGSKGNLFLIIGQSLDPLNSLIMTHSWRLLISIGLILLCGALIYRRLMVQLFTPLGRLLAATRSVSDGDLSQRIEVSGQPQFAQLGRSFNRMLSQLESLYQHRLEQEKKTALTQETLKYNDHLRKKNLEIEKKNIQLKEQYQELSALFQVTQSMISSLDQTVLFERIFQALLEALDCDHAVLLLYHPGSETLEVVKTAGFDAQTVKGLSFRLDEGISGYVATSQKMIYSPDLTTDDRNLNYKGRWVSAGSLLSVPMTIQNRLIGVLNLHHEKTDAFPPLAQQMAQTVASQAAIAIENARLYEKTKTLSATDELTGLANRRQFQEFLHREWAQARRHHNSFSILMVDIDHFKLFNDSHGHLRGDVVLKKVASLLLQNTRGVDLVARFGGEEFVLLLPKANRQGSLTVAEKLRQCIAEEYFAGAETSQPQQCLTISIGTSSFPADSTDIYDLLNLADEALYLAKSQGRNQVVGWQRNPIPTQQRQAIGDEALSTSSST